MHGKCMGINRDGGACSGQARPGRSMCAWHDPQLAAERAGWRQKGGQRRSNKARTAKRLPSEVMTMSELQGVLCVVLRDVIDGKTEPGIGNCAAGLGRAIAAVAQVAEIEDRLAALESAANLGTGRRA